MAERVMTATAAVSRYKDRYYRNGVTGGGGGIRKKRPSVGSQNLKVNENCRQL